jgi:hypothetical protein
MTDHEMRVKASLESKGFKVFHRGIPDFLVINNSSGNHPKVFFVEAKKSEYQSLRREQLEVHDALASCGMVVYLARGTKEPISDAETFPITIMSSAGPRPRPSVKIYRHNFTKLVRGRRRHYVRFVVTAMHWPSRAWWRTRRSFADLNEARSYAIKIVHQPEIVQSIGKTIDVV